ncbi:MAG: glutathione S-transferase family protein [Hyphomicrobiales bacterium]|nr:glutathione S-transferase family protein [Hyphomicrobiales bacterium]
MPLKIWGRLTSINVQKAMLCIEELDLPHERIDAGLAYGIVDTPEYRARNPNGLVPTLDDDGFVLWESNAIVRYLAAKHASGSLWPDDPRGRADADRWMDWQTTALQPAMGPAFMHLVRLPPEKRDPKAVEPSRQKTEDCMAIMENVLGNQRFIAGDRMTVGDIALAPAVHRWLNLPVTRQRRPYIERWYGEIMGRPRAARALILPVV